MAPELQDQVPRKRVAITSMLVGWIISVFLIAAIAWNVPLNEVWSAITASKAWTLFLAMALVVVSISIRSSRWYRFFPPHQSVTPRGVAAPIMIGLALNAVLPGRAGEIARAVMVARKYGTGLLFTGATIMGERLFDSIAILALLGLSVLALKPDNATLNVINHWPDTETLVGILRYLALTCVGLVVVTALLLIDRVRSGITAFVYAVPAIGPRVSGLLSEFLTNVSNGLLVLRSGWLSARIALLSLLIWLTIAAANYVVALGMTGVQMGVFQVIGVTAISTAMSSLPSSPGAWGVFEAGVLLALYIFGVQCAPGSDVAYAFSIHICHYVPVVVLGSGAGFLGGISLRQIQDLTSASARSRPETDTRISERAVDGS